MKENCDEYCWVKDKLTPLVFPQTINVLDRFFQIHRGVDRERERDSRRASDFETECRRFSCGNSCGDADLDWVMSDHLITWKPAPPPRNKPHEEPSGSLGHYAFALTALRAFWLVNQSDTSDYKHLSFPFQMSARLCGCHEVGQRQVWARVSARYVCLRLHVFLVPTGDLRW